MQRCLWPRQRCIDQIKTPPLLESPLHTENAMKTSPTTLTSSRIPAPNRRGIALIVVISILGLITVMMLAAFTLSESELKGARHYASGQQARTLADVTANVVISQLRKGTGQENTAIAPTTIWTSQPGMVRKYDQSGALQTAYKLYSSSSMVVPGGVGAEAQLLQDGPPADWQAQPERYVDLNRPLTRADASGGVQQLFPIIDPRAMTAGPDSVPGFSYNNTLANGVQIGGVQTTGGDAQRLPMPVEWLYVLKDGNLGTLDAAKKYTGAVLPTEANPIVGRVAFWTDDESSKVNINTASEPTPWALPTFFHQNDSEWAKNQPVNGEFQRYPGHPATTSLSTILFPEKTNLTVADKDLIYALAPKIGTGGSKSGSVGYDDPALAAVDLAQYRSEHLYASLDEFLLKNDRSKNDFGTATQPAQILQRKGFFLTANSRAPESNPFGLPKIAMWPVSYRGTDFRTPYDQVLAFCSTLNQGASTKRLYMFQRGYADSTTADITQADNTALINYLIRLLEKRQPGFSPELTDNFKDKYGDDLNQIIVEFFDYIRSVNLQDSFLTTEIQPPNTTANILLGYSTNNPYTRPINFKTFTDPRFVQNGVDAETGQTVQNEFRAFPGHGQVTPSLLTKGSKSFLGIGRFPTLSEVGLHFIVAADNTNDPNTPFPLLDPALGKAGGGSALKSAHSNPPTVNDRWYSNFPPTPAPDPTKNQAANMTKYPKTQGYPYGSDKTHPGYKQENWNWQLSPNTPLAPGKRRVQARMLLEFFIPASGYTIIEPEFTVVVTGLGSLRLNGQQLFPNSTETVRTGRRATHNGTAQTGGSSLGVKGFMRNREVPARGPMPADNQWGGAQWQVKPSSETPAPLSVVNYDLVSNFIDIDVGMDGTTPMVITNPTNADINFEIWSGHKGKIVASPETTAMKVQTAVVQFPTNLVKAPTLVRTFYANQNKPNFNYEAPYWWTFYGKGCMGFSVASLKANTASVLDGRSAGTNIDPLLNNHPTKGAFIYGYDPDLPGAPRIFQPARAVSSQADIDLAEEEEGSDVVQTMIVKHGDYRLAAATDGTESSKARELWKPHRNWGVRRLAHNFSNQSADQMPGYDYGGTADLDSRLVQNTSSDHYATNRIPDFPYLPEAVAAAHRHYDFDNGFGPDRDGPYINKPDEGSLGSASEGTAYFTSINKATQAGGTFFTPNRQIPSPVIFGSLPTGIKSGEAWRTLLFRPQQDHPGGPQKAGGTNPADHLFLEYFWMPVVEPYAISEPFSTAGKVNLNYQILPFTNIRRATGLHAVMDKELVTAVSNADMADSKNWPVSGDTSTFWKDSDGKKWHHKLDVTKTLSQLDTRFSTGGVYLTPSEFCDIHLIPDGISDASKMAAFWENHRATGDNTRERPYSTIYPRLTTRSNTYRVHMVVQVIKKARSSAVDTMTDEDKVTGEYRGSSVIERYLDPTQTGLPDFTSAATTQTLDALHQYRVIQSKKFGS